MKDYEYKTHMARLAGEKIVYVSVERLRKLKENPDFLSIEKLCDEYYILRNAPEGAVGMMDDYWICLV